MSGTLKKIIPVLVLLAILTPSLASAATNSVSTVLNLLSCTENPATCTVYAISNVLAYIGGLLVALAAFLTKVAFNFTFNVVNSTVVKDGFGVTLTIANLGFIIGIVIIALATIFRNQTYGIKQLLIKLVVMAVLVNFGLVLSGVVINFSNQLTAYFLGSFPGGGNGDYSTFVNSIMTAAAPQGLYFDISSADPNNGFLSNLQNTAENAAGAQNFFAQLGGLIFVVVFTMLLALVLLAVAVMFFLRYFWLTFLLILLPLAWVAYVFPDLKKHWDKWWQHFIKWTFFAPVLMFFLYLASEVAQGNYIKDSVQNLGNDQTGVAAQLSKAIGRQGLLGNITKELIVLGLIFGGLMAANSLGIAFAGTTMSGAKKAGGWMWGRTARRGRVVGGATAKAIGLDKLGRKMQEAGGKRGAVGWALAAPIRGLGARVTRLTERTTKGTFKEYQELFKNMSEEERLNRVPAARGIEQVALLESLKDGKRFGEAVARIDDKGAWASEDTFDRWGQKELHGMARAISPKSQAENAKRADELRKEVEKDPANKAAVDELKKIDENMKKMVKSLDGDKLAAAFKTHEKGKAPGGMDIESEEYKRWRMEMARSEVLYAPVSKWNKIMENDDPEVRDNFVKALNDSGIKWEEIRDKNKALATYLVGKGRGFFEKGELTNIDIPPKEEARAAAAAGATT